MDSPPAPNDTMTPEAAYEEDIPREGTPERTRLAASAMHRREQQAYGGAIQWEAAFFGWLVAVGLGAILIAMVVGAGVAVGLTELDDPARTQVAMTAVLALTAVIAGGDVSPLESLDLPRIPVDEEGELTSGGAIALAVVAVVMLASAVAGGIGGERFHRAVDEAGTDSEVAG